VPEPRDIALQADSRQPDQGPEETFTGYGVMGCTFRSGHILAMRRFASSLGPRYTSVWHREPDGSWTFYSDVDPLFSCNRYFGSAIDRFQKAEIIIEWTGPRALAVSVPSVALHWELDLSSALTTRAMNWIGALLPQALWHSAAALNVMSGMATLTLGAGKVRLQGKVPNGQSFIANPRWIWIASDVRATLAGEDLEPAGSLQRQAWLGDFAIPQRPLLAVGGSSFEAFDSERHLAQVTRAA